MVALPPPPPPATHEVTEKVIEEISEKIAASKNWSVRAAAFEEMQEAVSLMDGGGLKNWNILIRKVIH